MSEPPTLPPPRPITGTTRVLLVVLRVYVFIAVPLVVFTFFHMLKR
jgi:hypothetical protein